MFAYIVLCVGSAHPSHHSAVCCCFPSAQTKRIMMNNCIRSALLRLTGTYDEHNNNRLISTYSMLFWLSSRSANNQTSLKALFNNIKVKGMRKTGRQEARISFPFIVERSSSDNVVEHQPNCLRWVSLWDSITVNDDDDGDSMNVVPLLQMSRCDFVPTLVTHSILHTS